MKDFLNSIHPIRDEILDPYIAKWKPYSLPKKTVMTAAGDTENYFYFVLSGIQKSYLLVNDKEHVIAFTYAPSFSGVPDSFFGQNPSKCYLETITDSTFLRISYDEHQAFLNEHKEIESLYRILLEQLLIGLLERYYELMSLDIESRFKSFAKRSPHLLRTITQKDLASYLRIDSTNFSKLINSIKI